MKAIVLMDNVFPSVKDAYYANKMVPEVQTLGGITLNKSVGALNATAAGYAIRLGAKYVKLFSLANRVWPKLRKLYPGRLLPGHDPFTILNGDGALIPEAKELLKVVNAMFGGSEGRGSSVSPRNGVATMDSGAEPGGQEKSTVFGGSAGSLGSGASLGNANGAMAIGGSPTGPAPGPAPAGPNGGSLSSGGAFGGSASASNGPTANG